MSNVTYDVVEAGDPKNLAKLVTEKLSQGWELYGSPYVDPDPTKSYYHHQAMIKKETAAPVRGLPSVDHR